MRKHTHIAAALSLGNYRNRHEIYGSARSRQAAPTSRRCHATRDNRCDMQTAPPLGIIMLDTDFHRPLGDAGNPASWPFPVIIERVPQAFARDVVTGTFNDLTAFKRVSQLIRAQGVNSIISTCGFLARIPVINWAIDNLVVIPSTLFQYQALKSKISSEKRVAILTIDASSIDQAIRDNCGISNDTIIASPARTSHFCRAILDGDEPLAVARAETEWVEVATRTQRAHPGIGLWLFECANMPPYRAAIERATGIPVYDILHLGIELHGAVLRQAQDERT
jgi:hypothetical protein